MRAYLRPTPVTTWSELRSLPMSGWLWFDMAGQGVHLETALPAAPPPQISHVWGWSATAWVRARLDVDLAGDSAPGVAGAVLTTDVPADAAHPDLHDVEPFRASAWTPDDQEVSLKTLGRRPLAPATYTVWREIAGRHGYREMMPASFLQVEPSWARS